MPWRGKEFRECLRRGLLAMTGMQKSQPCMSRNDASPNNSKSCKGRVTRPPRRFQELTGSSQEEIGDSQPIVQFMPSGIDNDGLSDDIEGKRIKIDRVDPAVDD